ncbi:MAG: DUF3015 family protein [Spirochaetes bacterium]|nr:DUF3015 family protein [Spirochaetota bacterium]MBN2771225.1 DUF3015 family protein [Spirochaetota bacterium]
MKKILTALLVLGFVVFNTSVFADNTGCGLGTLVMQGKKGKVFEILAVTTNSTFASQTFAITSGTSGYKEGATIGMRNIENFVAMNMDNLASDIAKGNGEYIDTLGDLMGVEDKASFNQKLSSNFNTIYSSENVTSTEVVSSIFQIAKS